MKASAAREQLYDIFSRPETDVLEQVSRALELGSAYLDLPVGFFTRIDSGRQEIRQAIGENPQIQRGEQCPLEDAYCRKTVEIESTLSVQAATDSPDISQRAVDQFGLGSYIGAKVVVDGEPFGTVCFADKKRRESAFTDAEEYFVELLAGLVGQAIKQREQKRELENREQKLEKQREIYDAVIESSFDLVFRIDTDGQFTFISPSVETLLGYAQDELVGESFTRLLPDAESTESSLDLFEQVMAGETVEQQYLPLQHRNGSRVFVDVRMTPIYDDSGDQRTSNSIVAAQGTTRDATDRFRRDRLIRVLNRVLRHNLRNDITIVQGFAETLRERVDGEEADFAGRIIRTSNRLIALSETARKLEETLQNSPEMASRDLVPYVERASTAVDEQYPGASVQIDAPETVVIRTAPRIETALWELVDNAAKHGGEQPAITLTVTDAEDAATIQVSDDGPGLPEQERDVLVSGEETALVHGSGLGLWLVHWILESIGGEIHAKERETGSCIEISIPKERDP